MPSIRLIPIDEGLRQVVERMGGEFDEVFGASLGGNGAIVADVVTETLALSARAPRAPEWGGYLAADEEQALVVGTCGYKHGPEADGTVEIAYFTFPGFEGRGYATAMARELLSRAIESGLVRGVVAHTLPQPNASTRILEKVGMRRAGEARDDDVGRVWRWACRSG